MDLEELEISTYNQRMNRENAFRASIEARAQEKIELTQRSATPMTMDNIVAELFEKRSDMNFLFQFKVQLFKKEEIKNSKNEDSKKKIRQSRDIFEILSILKDF
jgi:hypothetical protein